MIKLKDLIKNIFTLLYYLPGFIQKPAIHYKIDCKCVCHNPFYSKPYCYHCKGDNEVGRYWKAKSEQEIEDSLISTYHKKVENFIKSKKKKITL